MSFGDLELHGHSDILFGVNWSGPRTSSTTNHIFFKALGWLHGPRCKQPLSYDYWKCMLVDFVARCMERHVAMRLSRLCFGIECRVGTIIWKCSPTSVKHVTFFDVPPLVLIKPCTNQIYGSDLETESLQTHVPYVVMIIGCARLLIPRLSMCVRLIVFIIECGVVTTFWKHRSILLKHMSLWCFFFNCHRTTYQLNRGVRLRKATQWTPTFIRKMMGRSSERDHGEVGILPS
jgi:hypothetical protein